MLVEKYLHGSFTLSLLHIPTAFSAAAACATSFGAAAEERAAAYGACAYTRAVTMDPILLELILLSLAASVVPTLGPSPMQTIIYQHCKSQMTFVSEFTSSQGLALNVDKCEASISSHWPKDLPYTQYRQAVYILRMRVRVPRCPLACITPVAPVASLHSTHQLPFT